MKLALLWDAPHPFRETLGSLRRESERESDGERVKEIKKEITKKQSTRCGLVVLLLFV